MIMPQYPLKKETEDMLDTIKFSSTANSQTAQKTEAR